MVARPSGIDSVFIRVVRDDQAALGQAAEQSEADTRGGVRRVRYLALVYSQLPLPIAEVTEPPAGQPTEWSGHPLMGAESFFVHWGKYAAYLDTYLEGEKTPETMERRLFDALPEGLSAILSGQFGGTRPTRTWFHSEAQELTELPWELVAFANGHRAHTGGSFVRGEPPTAAAPLLPLSGRLRLGVIDPANEVTPGLYLALAAAADRLEVVRLSGGIREALAAAASQGLELIHLVTDGVVASSLEALLQVPGSDEPPLAAGEVGMILRGSRARLIALTPPGPEPFQSGGTTPVVPVAYRAFSSFASTPLPIPSVVAPLGPMGDAEAGEFWARFYGALGELLEIEPAMARAQQIRPAAVALFLRQLQAATFRQVTEEEQPSVDPSILDADLTSSRELLGQFESVKASLGLKTRSLDRFVKGERRRQSQLAADVQPWIDGIDEQ